MSYPSTAKTLSNELIEIVRPFVAEVMEYHVPVTEKNGDRYCEECDDQWPCSWYEQAQDIANRIQALDRHRNQMQQANYERREERRRALPPEVPIRTAADVDRVLQRPKFRRLINRGGSTSSRHDGYTS